MKSKFSLILNRESHLLFINKTFFIICQNSYIWFSLSFSFSLLCVFKFVAKQWKISPIPITDIRLSNNCRKKYIYIFFRVYTTFAAALILCTSKTCFMHFNQKNELLHVIKKQLRSSQFIVNGVCYWLAKSGGEQVIET